MAVSPRGRREGAKKVTCFYADGDNFCAFGKGKPVGHYEKYITEKRLCARESMAMKASTRVFLPYLCSQPEASRPHYDHD